MIGISVFCCAECGDLLIVVFSTPANVGARIKVLENMKHGMLRTTARCAAVQLVDGRHAGLWEVSVMIIHDDIFDVDSNFWVSITFHSMISRIVGPIHRRMREWS